MAEKILIVTRGDGLTRIVAESLLRSPRYRPACLVVTGDDHGRTGASMLRALWRASEPHYFGYELCQFLLFRLVGAMDVARLCRELSVPCLATSRVMSAEADRFARGQAPDVLVSIKCPQRIREPLLTLASAGAVNVHASLLPRHAGRAPHFWSMAEGDGETGTTVHYMTERFDAGRILVQKTMPIEPGSTAFGNLLALMRLGGDALEQALPLVLSGEAGSEQDARDRSYHSHPTPEAYAAFSEKGHRLVRLGEMVRCARRLR